MLKIPKILNMEGLETASGVEVIPGSAADMTYGREAYNIKNIISRLEVIILIEI